MRETDNRDLSEIERYLRARIEVLETRNKELERAAEESKADLRRQLLNGRME